MKGCLVCAVLGCSALPWPALRRPGLPSLSTTSSPSANVREKAYLGHSYITE